VLCRTAVPHLFRYLYGGDVALRHLGFLKLKCKEQEGAGPTFIFFIKKVRGDTKGHHFFYILIYKVGVTVP
jgi:hypothetical protein